MTQNNNSNYIKFYANYKNGRYYISGKNEKNKWFSLWKNPEFSPNMYLDTEMFKGGIEIPKERLKLLPDEEGNVGKVLVFKTEDFERDFTISAEEIEKRKANKKERKNSNAFDYVEDIIKELFANNPDLKAGKIMQKILNELQDAPEEEDNLPF